MVTILALGILAGCSKTKYATKPQLKYKKVNTNFLNRNEQLRFTLEVTDAEGDIQDSIWVQEIVKDCSSSGFISKYKMPDFSGTKDLKGDIEICYGYGINLGCPLITHSNCVSRNDSTVFRFWIQDNAKNVSDTITSEDIVIAK